MKTRFEDAVDVLFAGKSVDELDETEKAILRQLVGLEVRQRGTTGKALVTKSQGENVQFYQGFAASRPATVPFDIGLPSAQSLTEKSFGWTPDAYSPHDVTRASCGLFSTPAPEAALIVEPETAAKSFARGIGIHEILRHGFRRQDWPML